MEIKFMEKIINKEVVVSDMLGKVHKGRLAELDGGAIKIVVDVRGIAVYIPYDSVASIKVMN